ncbi:MAG TPA: response regulator [Myxococcales bacterium]|jgi:DNA-binding response OmpR family regulator
MCPSEEDALHPRLLVIDDEPVIAHVVRLAFEQAGFVVTDVGDGSQAAQLLQKESFDAAIIDKNLPGVDGVQLCALARERSRDMALVLMTAYATRESAAELLKVGVDDYVEKPFDLDDLTDRVQRILVRKRKVAHASRVVEAVRSRRGAIRRVQMVEPCEAHRQAVETALTDLGIEVHCAGEGGVPDATFDALILSARLVDHALVDRLGAAREARPDFQVVVLSDRHSLDDDIAAIMVGACAVVALPSEPGPLREALANGLGLARPAT